MLEEGYVVRGRVTVLDLGEVVAVDYLRNMFPPLEVDRITKLSVTGG